MITGTITISAYRRPDYLRKVLDALEKCENIESYNVAVLIDRGPLTTECFEVAYFRGWINRIVPVRDRLGCDRMIHRCMGFYDPQSKTDFHIHIEDDCVPQPGFLRYFEWAAQQYLGQDDILAICGFNLEPDGAENHVRKVKGFHSWGWGTWGNMWKWLGQRWSFDGPHSWDTYLQEHLLKDSYVIRPCVSFVQNIGFDRAEHVPSKDFHAQYHEARALNQSIHTQFEQI